jgi:hypothetical protein
VSKAASKRAKVGPIRDEDISDGRDFERNDVRAAVEEIEDIDDFNI